MNRDSGDKLLREHSSPRLQPLSGAGGFRQVRQSYRAKHPLRLTFPHVAGDWTGERHSGVHQPWLSVVPLNKLSELLRLSRSSASDFVSSPFNISAMDFYKGNFAAFALLNAILAFREYRQVEAPQEKDDESRLEAEGTRVVLDKFKWNFIPIYLLVNGADWLQVRNLLVV
jgi:hypothetical protein